MFMGYDLSYLGIKVLTFDYWVIRRELKKFLRGKDYSKILDFGCGIGTLASNFDKDKYLGIDIDKKAINIASKRNPGYDFKVADGTNFKLEGKFDIVIVIGVLHHLDDKEVEEALKILKSLLSKRGNILVIEAIPPILSFNIIGRVLRLLDNGHFVRQMKDYSKLIKNWLFIKEQKAVMGGIVDYGVFILAP